MSVCAVDAAQDGMTATWPPEAVAAHVERALRTVPCDTVRCHHCIHVCTHAHVLALEFRCYKNTVLTLCVLMHSPRGASTAV